MQPNGGTQRCAAGTGLWRTWWPASGTAHRPDQGWSVTVASPALGVDEAAVVVAQGGGVAGVVPDVGAAVLVEVATVVVAAG